MKKKCSKCKQHKKHSEFWKNKSNKDGLSFYCIPCKKERNNGESRGKPETKRKWYENNRTKHNEYVRNYYKRKRECPVFRMRQNIRQRTRKYLKTQKVTKRNSFANIIGCTPSELKAHIEKQFTPEMSWDNYGTYWSVDHIIPISKGLTERAVNKLSHYSNLQPLENSENITKKDSLKFV